MTMPNFFIIGAQKAGTTSLYHYLKQHPQIYMSPVKEPFFFNHEIDENGRSIREKWGGPGHVRNPKFASIEEYSALFDGVTGEKAFGEASVLYIYAPGTAERIKGYVPEARIVALLRNPADRAYSSFLNAVRGGREPQSEFAQVLREEDDRIRDNWHYIFRYRDRGCYYEQLKPYYEVFGRERVGVWLYEDMKDAPVDVVQSVFRFLGVDDRFVPDTSSRHNPATVPKNAAARNVIRFMNTTLPIVRKVIPPASKVRKIVQRRVLTDDLPKMDPKIRRELLDWYKEDIMKTQKLIGQDLLAWLR